MSTSVVANRIYSRASTGGAIGRYAAEDFDEMAPDVVLLRGCKPPTKQGGLFLPGAGTEGEAPQEQKDHPVRACVAFEVIKLPKEQSRGNPMNLVPGDVVLARNVLVDPLLGDEYGLTDMYMGIAGVLERAPETKETA